jgi:regulator of replication initiation timing
METIFESDWIIIVSIGVQLLWALYAIIQLRKVNDVLLRDGINYYIFESIPGVFVTIGLLGTCSGIAYGLIHFDVDPETIKDSIKTLLTGLKSAFLVTILGLILSLIFKHIINGYLHKYSDIQPPESPELVQLKWMNKHLVNLGDKISDSFSIKFDEFLKDVKKTNQNLIHNLDNFSSSLAEQNQQALVEALEVVVEDLNTGFKDILGSLVKQNFQALTDSVDNLNKWQQQHMVQVDSLTKTFNKVVSNTEKLDKSLGEIIQKNDQLIGQNSKLNQIIDSLSKVLVDDKRFVAIVDNLNTSSDNMAKSSKDYSANLIELKKMTSEIENWFKGEHNIKESIILLQSQLDGLSKVRVDQIPMFTDSLKQTFGTLDKVLSEYQKAIPKLVEKAVKERIEA